MPVASESKSKPVSNLKLNALSPDDKKFNYENLKETLLYFGEYPAKYRNLIWRFILCLPENKEAFDNLCNKGLHSSLNDLHKRYPISSASLYRRFEKYFFACINCIGFFPTFPIYVPSSACLHLFQRYCSRLSKCSTMI